MPEPATRARIRLADVAAETGVSVQVASVVLNGRHASTAGASEETRQRVLAAAKRLGYRRHNAAASLRRQRHGRAGLLMAGTEDNVFLPQDVLAGIVTQLNQHKLGLTLDSVVLRNPDAISQSRLINEDCVDVMIVALVEEPSAGLTRLVRSIDRPVLWMHRPTSRNSVAFDEAGAAAALVEHLASTGHRTVHFIDLHAPRPEVFAPAQRAIGFEEACLTHGIDGRLGFSQRVPRRERAEYFKAWLAEHPEPTAVILASCSAAQVMLDVAIATGRRVPETLAIAAFDNGSMCTANAPTITSAIVPERQLGLDTGEMAASLVKQPQARLAHRRLACIVQVGGTTSP